jgi:hypothetical protein
MLSTIRSVAQADPIAAAHQQQHRLRITTFVGHPLFLVPGLIAIIAVWNNAINVLYLGLIAWAMLGPRQAIQALLLSWLFGYLNPAISGDHIGLSLLRYSVTVAAFFQSIVFSLLKQATIPPLFSAATCYFICMFPITLMASYTPDVSTLKLISFWLGVSAVALSVSNSQPETERIQRWVGAFLLACMVTSTPLYFFHLGYVRNGRGFQGILNHPQSLGVFLAVSLTFFMCGYLTGRQRSRTAAAAVLLGLFALPTTQSRAGILGFCLAVGVLLPGLLTLRSGRQSRWNSMLSVMLVLFVIVGGATAVVLVAPTVERYGLSLLTKHGGDTVAGSLYESRGKLAEASWQNFLEHPWFGIGFGVPTNLSALVVRRDPILGLPVGAPVEKGVLPTAVLEETGAVGAILLVGFLVAAFFTAIQPSGIVATCVFAVSLSVNMGEAALLSFNGMGAFLWLLIGLSVQSGGADDC